MSVATDIIDTKVFLGLPKNKSNPKTRDSWLGVANGQVVFDPKAVEEQLKQAKDMVASVKKTNKDILIICEKELYKEEVEALAEKTGAHYLNHKVPAGVLTNFDTLLSRIRSLKEMRAFVASESFESLTKKEQQMKKRALRKIEKVYKGVADLRKMPELVIIVDGQYMHKFVDEVQKMNKKTVILASSDFDMRTKDKQQLVMCNVNGYASIDYVLKYLLV